MNTTTEEYAEDLLRETREELVRADNKAQILLAAFSLVAAAVLAGLMSGDWSPSRLDRGATEVFWVGCGLVASSFLGLGYAIWPRIRHREADGRVTYFGHVRSYATIASLTTALDHEASSESRTVEQLRVCSDLVWRKYAGIRAAIVLYGLALALCAGSAIVG